MVIRHCLGVPSAWYAAQRSDRDPVDLVDTVSRGLEEQLEQVEELIHQESDMLS